MERNNKNQNAAFLMVVGVIFIVIAGSIFVTTAWKHLPMIGKQMILFAVTLGLFVASRKALKSKKMEKTEKALFYLGVVFSGFFTLSVLGEISGYASGNASWPKAFNLMIVNLVMMIVMIFRFLKTRNGLDFGVSFLLLCGVLVAAAAAFIWSIETFSLISAGITMMFAIGDSYRKVWLEENRGLNISFNITYLLCGSWLILCATQLEKEFCFILILVLFMATFLTYKARNRNEYRVLNSIFILGCVSAGVDCVNLFLPESVSMSLLDTLFIVYVIDLVIMVCTMRKEMAWLLSLFGLLVPFAQLVSYGGYFLILAYIPHKPQIYRPFTACMMIAMVFLVKRGIENGRFTWEEKGKRIIKAAGIQIITVLLMLQAAVKEGFIVMGFYVLVMVLFLTAAVLLKKNGIGKAVLYTLALCAGELAMLAQPYFEIPKTHKVEWICFLLGIGIVLLKRIWYDEVKAMEMASFILTCILLAVLLLNDMIQGGIGNVIILGVTGGIMLLLATVFNRRKYVIAASVTLILLVLYITRSFWLSIAWWVYLFAAGVAFILLAIKKESESE